MVKETHARDSRLPWGVREGLEVGGQAQESGFLETAEQEAGFLKITKR